MSTLISSLPFNGDVHFLRAERDFMPPERGVTLSHQLSTSFRYVEEHITHLPEPYSCCMLFFSVAAPGQEAGVFFVRRPTLEAAWREGSTRVRQWAWVRKLKAVELRIDWPHQIFSLEGRPFDESMMKPYQGSAWALADEDLENAELTPPVRLRGDTRRPAGPIESPSTAAAPAPHWLLLMRGMHMGSDGAQLALPRVHTPFQSTLFGDARSAASRLPYVATLKMLCDQQQPEGSWESAVDVCEHLGMTYALLLAQRHIPESEPVHGTLADTIDRAVAYLRENLEPLLLGPGGVHAEQAICMVVFARYLESRNDFGESSDLAVPMEQLEESLGSAESMEASGSQEWVALAREIFKQLRVHGGHRTSPTYPADTAAAEAYKLEGLLESFLASLPVNQDGTSDWLNEGKGPERWHAIAIAESLYVTPYPQMWRDHHLRRRSADLQAFLSSARMQIVQPEIALFWPAAIRENAAFIRIAREGNELLTNACAAARLLVSFCVVCELLDI
ncbi:MAG: hypothetical protein WBC18_19455 [Ottowia sp.]|uniref:hypothetical protein n=1 Tax=Ottowia sp. TaxID=1898956 RepID=UPI003C767F6A